MRRKAAIPLQGATPRGRRHSLIERQCFRIPIGGLRGEGAVKTLHLPEELDRPFAALVGTEVAAGCKGPGFCRIELERRSVSAVFIEKIAAYEPRQIGRLDEFHAPIEDRMLGVLWDVDSATLGWIDGLVAFCVEHIAFEAHTHWVQGFRHEKVQAGRVVVSVTPFEESPALRRALRDDIDDATQRVITPDARAASSHDLNLF